MLQPRTGKFTRLDGHFNTLDLRLGDRPFGANDLDGTITDGGELTHSYSVESGGEVKMSKHEIIEMIHRAGFEAVERDTVYNRVAAV
jgi:2-iminoacetate synthase ThiH